MVVRTLIFAKQLFYLAIFCAFFLITFIQVVMVNKNNTISRNSELSNEDYKWGFSTDVETELAPKGLSEDIVRLISGKKNEPDWLLEWRLKAFRHWVDLEDKDMEPKWARVQYPRMDFHDIYN